MVECLSPRLLGQLHSKFFKCIWDSPPLAICAWSNVRESHYTLLALSALAGLDWGACHISNHMGLVASWSVHPPLCDNIQDDNIQDEMVVRSSALP